MVRMTDKGMSTIIVTADLPISSVNTALMTAGSATPITPSYPPESPLPAYKQAWLAKQGK